MALLKKQKLVLTAISELTAQAPVIPTLPEQKPYGISIYDGWLKSLDDIRSEINTNQEHRASQKVVTVAAINQLETTRKGIRKINEAPPIAQTDAQLRRARLEEATANAWWQLSKMQEYLLQLTADQLSHVETRLENGQEEIKRNTAFTQQQLDEQIAFIDERRDKLKDKLTATQRLTEKARATWLKSQRRVIQSPDKPTLRQELDANYQSLQKQILQTELHQFSLERIAIEKLAWQQRYLAWGDANQEVLSQSRESLRVKALVLDQQNK